MANYLPRTANYEQQITRCKSHDVKTAEDAICLHKSLIKSFNSEYIHKSFDNRQGQICCLLPESFSSAIHISFLW